jgi:putative ABC transport system permease protein
MDYFTLALRNTKRKGVRSYLTLLGICIGIMAVVSLITLGNGLKLAVNSQFGVSSTELITVQASGGNFGPPGSSVIDPLTSADVDAIKRLGSVKNAIGRKIETGKLEFNNKVVFGYAVDVPDGADRKFDYDNLDVKVIAGRLLKDGDSGKVFLGYNFYADKVGLDKAVIPGNKVKINGKDFEVIGIIDKKGSFIYDNLVYMNRKDLQVLMNYGDVVDYIDVLPTEKNNLNRTTEDIARLLRQRRNVKIGEQNFVISTPEASLSQVDSIINGIQIFIIIIASISIIIGAVGIINTMTISVLERRKEIGIMKAIGAKNSQIFMQFFIESGFLGLVGGGIGVLLGVLIGYVGTAGINNFVGATVKPMINFYLIFFALLGSFLIGALSGIFPAMRAAKQNPVEALRG